MGLRIIFAASAGHLCMAHVLRPRDGMVRRGHFGRVALVGGALLSACMGNILDGDGSDYAGDVIGPMLRVDAPERASILEMPTVGVHGFVQDSESGVASVTVNGLPAKLESDGTFHINLTTAPGMAFL